MEAAARTCRPPAQPARASSIETRGGLRERVPEADHDHHNKPAPFPWGVSRAPGGRRPHIGHLNRCSSKEQRGEEGCAREPLAWGIIHAHVGRVGGPGVLVKIKKAQPILVSVLYQLLCDAAFVMAGTHGAEGSSRGRPQAPRAPGRRRREPGLGRHPPGRRPASGDSDHHRAGDPALSASLAWPG